MHQVNWPVHGNRQTFHRELGLRLAAGSMLVLGAVALTAARWPDLLAPVLPLATGALMMLLLWSHARASHKARRVEVLRSFAGMTVVYQGHAVNVKRDAPLIGEFSSRSDAVRAAIVHGRWAVIVLAWGRYYALAGSQSAERRVRPLSFRTAAVADVVPSVMDEALLA